ncbi:hypothetical protein LMUR_14414 [Listeria grayi FSL F6-1183]|uniref:Uncharacterized protein n=1 Tax=Listeria grayi FSL F6-1183 TaxID=1265827 RepID=A0A829R3K6_LISGR|nr:hypothetical protein LMUR_14414 [Listeria grayi FSL F6-1183]
MTKAKKLGIFINVADTHKALRQGKKRPLKTEQKEDEMVTEQYVSEHRKRKQKSCFQIVTN